MVQTEMLLFTKQKPYTEGDLPMINLFNEYFGSGLSSIVFQEIREAKALAYSAYSFVTTPSKPDRSHYVQAYIGTQVDKQKEATKAMLELMNNMPEVNDQYEGAKLAALKKIETSRTKENSLFWRFLSAKELGRDYDINTKVYPAIKEMQLSDLKNYFDNNIKGKNYAFLVIGNKKLVNKKALSEQGEYKELTLEEIFGY